MIIMMAGAVALYTGGQVLVDELMVLMKSSLAVERGDLLAPHFIVLQLKRFTLDIAVSMLPLLSIMLVVALFSPIALGGWSFSLQAMAPKFERISPLAGVKRIFSVQSAMELLKSLLKVTLIGSIFYLLFLLYRDEMLSLGDMPFESAQEFSKARMMTDVPKADVIITNPTHFAVALKYQPKTMDAPVVVAKGTDLIAERIRDIAKQHRVPIVSAPPLARAVYYTTPLQAAIPGALYVAVAQVLAFVVNLRNAKRNGDPWPKAPNPDIPEGFLDPYEPPGINA